MQKISKNIVHQKLYALIPQSVLEVNQYDDITHLTLQSPTPLFINPNMNIKQHIVTTYKKDDLNTTPCIIQMSDDELKDSNEKNADYVNIEDKNLKSIIRGASLRNKNGSSLSVKFKLENNETNKDEIKRSIIDEEKNKDLNEKIENYIPEEIKNIKIDKQTTEKRRASIFDESKSKNDKKKDLNNKIVLDSNKVKKATEIKLKRIQNVTGLLEKYDIPNPFEKYYMEEINYNNLYGLNNEAKLYSLALIISNNFYKYIKRSMERSEIKGVFNEKRKKMIIKVIELLGYQINTVFKKKLHDSNSIPIQNQKCQKQSKYNIKEKEIKIEEHNLICNYWHKQSESMSLLIKEWNKISEILESLNINPNNIIQSLILHFGEQVVMNYQLTNHQIQTQTIELDINIDDFVIPNVQTVQPFDASKITIMNLIENLQWDHKLEYSLNKIRLDWKNENKKNKKKIQKKIIEGIKHRNNLLDYLNKVEINLNAFAKLIERKLISSKKDIKSQLRSIQGFNKSIMSNFLNSLKSNDIKSNDLKSNDLKSESFKTPNSFLLYHHLPLTTCSLSGNSNDSNINELNNLNLKNDINNLKINEINDLKINDIDDLKINETN